MMGRTANYMRSLGTYISVISHVGLIGWLTLGWGLSSNPLPLEVSEVSVVSSKEFAALLAATTLQMDVVTPSLQMQPQTEEPLSTIESETAPQLAPIPNFVEQPREETSPSKAPELFVPPADLADATPFAPIPPTTEAPPDLSESPRPQQRPVPRIAPEAVPPALPQADVADVVSNAIVPSDSATAEVVEPELMLEAPEEAATEIVLEDVVPSSAVTTSVRPPTRSSRPAPVTPAQMSTVGSDTSDNSAVAAALADAMEASAPDLPKGPPMSGSEREGFRVAVNRCWNVDPGSEAARVTITVAFGLDQSGRIQGDVRQVASDGGTAGSQSIAFQAARRAILRCGAAGYDLPIDKYDRWRNVEITFDPSGMRMR